MHSDVDLTVPCLWQEHDVIESKPDHFLDVLRLNNPWPELKQYGLGDFYLLNINFWRCSCCADLKLHYWFPVPSSRFSETIDLNVTDPVVHKHTPYVVILVKMAEEWAKTHSGCLPSTREEKKEFKVCK